MPVVLDRLPLPNLTWYTGFSFVLLACSLYYAGIQVTSHSNWKDKYIDQNDHDDNYTKEDAANGAESLNPDKWPWIQNIPESSQSDVSELQCDFDPILNIPLVKRTKKFKNEYVDSVSSNCSKMSFVDVIFEIKMKFNNDLHVNKNHDARFTPYIIPDVISFMFHEPLCIWTLINMAYCILILLGTAIQRVVFGELRVSEQQHIKDKFWNFVFYKFIFVFGVMNVQAMDGVVLWCSWFSVLGFLHLLAQLCEDRFEYLSFSLTTPKRTHMRLLGLLGLILLLATSCLLITVIVGFHAGLNTFAFMAAECVLLMVRTLYVITRYCIYLWDISHQGLWERRSRYIYFTELSFELSELTIDMAHHIHMVIWANMLLTMASLVICMQVRLLFYQLQHKVNSHRNYMRVVHLIKRYPEVHHTTLAPEEETCAICWEGVEFGRLLSCKHMFHSSCLLSWLHHDLSCPTCRDKLATDPKDERQPGLFSNLMPMGLEGDESLVSRSETQGNTSRNAPSPGSPDGSSQGWRYVSWLSSFSVEQSHTQLPRHHQANSQPVATSQLDSLARQVQQMFTEVSYSQIYEDLRHTRSIETTIDNILENKLHVPPPMFDLPPDTESDGLSIQSLSSQDDDSENDLMPSISKVHFPMKLPFSSDSQTDAASGAPSSYSWEPVEEEGVRKDNEFPLGSRFSKSSREREAILAERKEKLIAIARLRFQQRYSVQKVDKIGAENPRPGHSVNGTENLSPGHQRSSGTEVTERHGSGHQRDSGTDNTGPGHQSNSGTGHQSTESSSGTVNHESRHWRDSGTENSGPGH